MHVLIIVQALRGTLFCLSCYSYDAANESRRRGGGGGGTGWEGGWLAILTVGVVEVAKSDAADTHAVPF